MPKKPVTKARKSASQERSKATVDALLAATTRVLVKEGYDHASTNKIAEAAGVSIGSLYQYFPDRDALIAELSRRHVAAMQAAVTAAISGVEDQPLEVAIRQLMGALVAAHRIDPRLDQALHRLLPLVGGAEIDAFEDVAATHAAAALRRHPGVALADPERSAVLLVQAVGGVIRTTLRRAPERVHDVALELELADLVLGFLARAEGGGWARGGEGE